MVTDVSLRKAAWPRVLSVVVCLVVAGALRLPDLAAKPMHGDEANQAHKAGRLLEGAGYRYDPHEHHGPTLYYLTLPVAWLRGQTTFAAMDEWTLRVVPAIFGVALVGVVVMMGRALPGPAAPAAAILLAVSPVMVYYSRYYIQEMLLVFFTGAALAAGWAYWRLPATRWAVLLGVALGLMHATKETCILAFGAMGGGLLITAAWERLRPAGEAWQVPAQWPRHLATGIAAGAATSATLFSSFGQHPRGILDSILTYRHYIERSGGEGSFAVHEQPFGYYLGLLAWTQRPLGPVWTEGFVLALAVIGAGAVVLGAGATGSRARTFQRFLLAFTVLLTLVYSVISYKTPWNVLSFYLGVLLLAGIGAGAVVTRARPWPVRAVVALVLAAFTVQLAGQAQASIGRYAADPRNPWVYAHTSTALMGIETRAEGLAAVHPEGRSLRIDVIHPGHDYWPIPWYLRRFDRVRYLAEPVAAPRPDMVLMPTRLAQEIGANYTEEYMSETFSLRPGVLWVAFIDRGLWADFMVDRQ